MDGFDVCGTQPSKVRESATELLVRWRAVRLILEHEAGCLGLVGMEAARHVARRTWGMSGLRSRGMDNVALGSLCIVRSKLGHVPAADFSSAIRGLKAEARAQVEAERVSTVLTTGSPTSWGLARLDAMRSVSA